MCVCDRDSERRGRGNEATPDNGGCTEQVARNAGQIDGAQRGGRKREREREKRTDGNIALIMWKHSKTTGKRLHVQLQATGKLTQ